MLLNNLKSDTLCFSNLIKQISLKTCCGLKHEAVSLESDIIFTKVSHIKGKSLLILSAGATNKCI